MRARINKWCIHQGGSEEDEQEELGALIIDGTDDFIVWQSRFSKKMRIARMLFRKRGSFRKIDTLREKKCKSLVYTNFAE
ncbi:MAG: hypothetical protein ACLS2X_00670 [Coprococcus sp.]